MEILIILLLCASLSSLRTTWGNTRTQDATVLRSLMSDWEVAPPSWGTTDDPCGTPWEGVSCGDSSVTVLKLSTMGIKGTLSDDIGELSELTILDLSSNTELSGQLTPHIGNLIKLTTLILAGCSFSGSIPDELGSLKNLSYLALNSNHFTGRIPASIGGLTNLYWFDIADNQLSGTLPVSTQTSPGLDQLLHTKHFHFNKNQLSGPIPDTLFNQNMTLLHVLFDGNNFSGKIPDSISLVRTIEVLRLDMNNLIGPVPSSINSLKNINKLTLANNNLSGSLPNLTGMDNLNYVDLSNNSFDPSETPAWFSELQSLAALVIQSGGLYGQVPETMFSLPQLQQVILDDNKFNGTLDMGNRISQQLQLVSFKNNKLSDLKRAEGYNKPLILTGNPLCDGLPKTYCKTQQMAAVYYSTSLAKCARMLCPQEQSLNPGSCSCAYAYQGVMSFINPHIWEVSNSTIFRELESDMWTKLGLLPESVFLHNLFPDDSYMQVQIKLFPSTGMYFNSSEVGRIGFDLSNQTYKPPKIFGSYHFLAFPYTFSGELSYPSLSREEAKSTRGVGFIVGIAAGCVVLVTGILLLAIYAMSQRKRAERAIEQSKHFAPWAFGGDESSSEAPQLKGARMFSCDELKRCCDNFSFSNEIGAGGYGKVYKGMLPGGQVVAIKRAQHESLQGGQEFKTEIELLSRVHHKNLVELVGFCFEQGEQMLVYEFVPNGTLRDSLSCKSGLLLDWRQRLRIALGSARGLVYLHELANPPIIHRDVKSSNILLDENLNAKVADFGLSKLVSDNEKGHVSTQVKGTVGYLDPEYFFTQQLTDKSDVYSFGVVMLEMVTARRTIDKGKYIVREVKMAVNEKDEESYGLKELVDPVLEYAVNPVSLRRFTELALKCLEESAADRPAMSVVVKGIEMLLHAEGLSTDSHSATDFGKCGAFQYSGGFSFSKKPEPK